MEIDADYNDIVRFQLLVEKLKETLQFYANPDNYKDGGNGIPVEDDCGQRARDILKERL